MLPRPPKFEAACRILRTLREAGYESYLAGGCVRDLMLGHEPKDFDVATAATPDVVLRMFPRTFAVGAHFGVVLVCSDRGEAGVAGERSEAQADEDVVIEVATFRCDGAYSDGRRPDEVRYTTSAAEDVQRRDFTINGLLLDPFAVSLHAGPSSAPRLDPDDESTGRDDEFQERLRAAVIDHVGGLSDLDRGVVRAIGHAELRVKEDHLRMLRGVRFAARLSFELEAETAAAIRRLAAKTSLVSRERVRDELTKMLTEGKARRAFELLDATGLLVEVLPEIARMKGVKQPPQFHPEGDVWTHTLLLLDQLEPG